MPQGTGCVLRCNRVKTYLYDSVDGIQQGLGRGLRLALPRLGRLGLIHSMGLL